MCSYGPHLMPGYYYLQALHRELQGVIIPQVALITYMDPYYSWSLKHSPLKAFLLITRYKAHEKETRRESEQTRDLGAGYNLFCVWRWVRNTKRKKHHFVFWWGNSRARNIQHCAHTHVLWVGDPSQSKGTLVMQLLFSSSPNCQPGP